MAQTKKKTQRKTVLASSEEHVLYAEARKGHASPRHHTSSRSENRRRSISPTSTGHTGNRTPKRRTVGTTLERR
ncbi:hypothetical protein F2Q70_00024314 [Brassica cretica]|uniref:Uncharacterized protein n=1 Tax=Brassica cretica TaxID=69181 RepID=A0A8S9LCK1_BRACR|nr:hypothetical protein F2Q70_00024314 [Brassica cretica]